MLHRSWLGIWTPYQYHLLWSIFRVEYWFRELIRDLNRESGTGLLARIFNGWFLFWSIRSRNSSIKTGFKMPRPPKIQTRSITIDFSLSLVWPIIPWFLKDDSPGHMYDGKWSLLIKQIVGCTNFHNKCYLWWILWTSIVSYIFCAVLELVESYYAP